MFSRKAVAGLLNDSIGHIYRFMGAGIVQQRDINLRRLTGDNVNNTENALATLGDEMVAFSYDRLMELMSGFNYYVECENEEAKEFLEQQLLRTRRELIWEGLGLAKITGVAALEVMWGLKNDKIIIQDLVPIKCDRILYEHVENDYRYKLRIATFNNTITGIEVDKNKIIDFQYYSVRVNNPYGIGCGGILAELVKKKSLVEQIWFEIAKNYSTPVKIGNIPETASETEVEEFFEVLKRMTKDATFIMPPGFELDVRNIAQSGADSLIAPLIDRYDEKISGLLLGESITGRELSNGSQTRDIIAASISSKKAFSLASSIADRLNSTIVPWLLAYNFTGTTALIKVEQPEDLNTLLSQLDTLNRIGIKANPDWVADKFGIKLKETKGWSV